MKRFSFCAIFVLLIISSYGQAKLIGSWKLYKIIDLKNKKELLVDFRNNSSITFTDSICKGRAVCNFFEGSYNASIEKLKINTLLQTEVGCHGTEKVIEDFLFKSFPIITTYKIKGETLFLTDQSSVKLIYLKSKE